MELRYRHFKDGCRSVVDGVYGPFTNREVTGTDAADTVDPFSGALQLAHVDYVAPGGAGFDIKIARHYRSLSKQYFASNYLGERSPIGIGWSLHFGRVVSPDNAPSCNNRQGNLLARNNSVWESPNGTTEQLLPANSSNNFMHEMITKSKWVADCTSDGYVLRSPDGTKYYANYFINNAHNENGTFDYHYVTKIEDVHGNSIVIEYGKAGSINNILNTRDQEAFQLSSSKLGPADLIKSVKSYEAGSSSVISEVKFLYNDIDSIHHRLSALSVGGTKVVTYDQDFAATGSPAYYYLTAVTLQNSTNEDYVWTYSYYPGTTNNYGEHNIREYFTPGNASISFTYKNVNFRRSTGSPSFDTTTVSTRVISGSSGGVQRGGTWRYDYSAGSSYDTTVETLPTGDKIEYQHQGADNYSTGEIWKVGLLLKKSIMDSAGSVKRSEVYAWERGLTLSTQNEIHLYKATDQSDNHYAPRLRSKTITIGSDTYSSTFSNFDPLDNPQTINESGDDSREIVQEWYSDYSTWVVGLQRKRTISGSDGGTFEKTFYSGGKGLVRSASEFGATTTFDYFTNGNLSYRDGPLSGTGDRTSYSNYSRGVPRTEAQPESVTITRVVNSSTGDITSETDGRNKTTTFDYDRFHNLTQVITPKSSDSNISIRQSFSSTGKTRTITRGGLTYTEKYDGLGRLLTITKSGSGVTSVEKRFEYDQLGRKKVEYDVRYVGQSSAYQTYAYDELDRIKSITYSADGFKVSYSYNSDHKVTITKSSGSILSEETHTFRAYGDPDESHLIRISQSIDGTNTVVTEIGRDKFGNITSVAQGGKTRNYYYDSYKHLDYILDPETGRTELLFDVAGNMTEKSVGSSGKTIYQYDNRGRLQYINYPGATPDVDFDYFNNDKLKFLKVESGSSVLNRWGFDYDDNDNLEFRELQIDAKTLRFSYSYTDLDYVSSVTYPNVNDGRLSVDYSPDIFGRPTRAGSYLSSISYYADGTLKSARSGNGFFNSYTRDSRLYPNLYTASRNGVNALDVDYGYNGIGNAVSIKQTITNGGLSSSANLTFDYDRLSRLTHVNGEERFKYDSRGNMSWGQFSAGRVNFAYDASTDRLISTTGAQSRNYSYDTYGNVTGDGAHSYVFDNASQLVSMDNNLKTYQYDGNGYRVKESSANGTRYALYVGDRLAMEIGEDGSKSQYIYLGNRLVSRVDYCSDGDQDGDHISDCKEIDIGFDPRNPADGFADYDGDGLSNHQEIAYGTDYENSDTDGDGLTDGLEVAYGSNPLVAEPDFDQDGLTNNQEISVYGTDPYKKDTDGDGISDGNEVITGSNPRFNPALIPIIFYINS